MNMKTSRRLCVGALGVAVLFCLAHQGGCISPTPAHGARLYRAGAAIAVDVGWLHSVPAVFPIAFDPALASLCISSGGTNVSLSDMLLSEQRMPSRYSLHMMSNVRCERIADCDAATGRGDAAILEQLIELSYRADLWVGGVAARDNTDSVRCAPGGTLPTADAIWFQRGYPVGESRQCYGATVLHNHLDFRLGVVRHGPPASEPLFELAHVEVHPRSILWPREEGRAGPGCALRDDMPPLTLDAIRFGARAQWSYSVTWEEESDWSAFERASSRVVEARYASLANGCVSMFLMCLALLVTCKAVLAAPEAAGEAAVVPEPEQQNGGVRGLLSRMQHRKKRHELELVTGWQATHMFVFHPPPKHHAWILAALVGVGSQLGVVLMLTVAAGHFGYATLDRTGEALLLMVQLLAPTAPIGGWITATVASAVDVHWLQPAVVAGAAWPLLMVGALCLVNTLSAAVVQGHALVDGAALWAMGGAWLLVVMLLHVVGGWLGASYPALGWPRPCTAASMLPEVPKPKLHGNAVVWIATVHLGPIGIVYLEWKLLQGALWRGLPYPAHPFVLPTLYTMWVVVCALFSIAWTVNAVAYRNYRWWWSSFLVSGCFGLPVAAWGAYYYWSQLALVSREATAAYATFVAVCAAAYGVVSGAIGLLASLVFLRYTLRHGGVSGEKIVLGEKCA